MPSTALVKDVLWRVSVKVLDTAPQFSRFSERECVLFLGDAQVAVNKFVPTAAARTDTIKLAPGTRQSIAQIAPSDCKPSDGSTPTTPIRGTKLLAVRRNMGPDGFSPGAAIRPVDGLAQDMFDPEWHTRIGTTVKGVVADPQTPTTFYVTPGAPPLTPVWVEVAMHAMPVQIPNTATVDADGVHVSGVYGNGQSSTQTITVSDEHVDDLVNYTVACLLMKESKHADPAKAAVHARLFVESINAKVQAMTGKSPGLTTLPTADR